MPATSHKREERFYVYALLDPRKPGKFKYTLSSGIKITLNYEPFYIGKGTGNRVNQHVSLARSSDTGDHRLNRIRCIHKDGYEVVTEQSRMFDHDTALRHEADLIQTIGRRHLKTGPLTNQTEGGEGTAGRVASKSTLAKMSKSQNAKWVRIKADPNRIEDFRKRLSNATSEYWEDADPKWVEARRNKTQATWSGVGSLYCPHCGYESSMRPTGQRGHAKHVKECKWKGLLPYIFKKAPTEKQKKELSAAIKSATQVHLSNKVKAMPTVTCPHCKKSGTGLGMRRWHFDNCKKRD